jgi:hypothetical protein
MTSEKTLYGHPAVEYCAIVGVPDPDRAGNERVRVVVQPKSKCSSQDRKALRGSWRNSPRIVRATPAALQVRTESRGGFSKAAPGLAGETAHTLRTHRSASYGAFLQKPPLLKALPTRTASTGIVPEVTIDTGEPCRVFATHEVLNQPPLLTNYNLYESDVALVEAVRRARRP